MNTAAPLRSWLTPALAGICCLTAAHGAWKFASARRLEHTHAEAQARRETLRGQIATLEQRISAAEASDAAIQRDNTALREALEKAQTAARVAATPTPAPTRSEAETRIAAARTLATDGDPDAALKELLWCWDHALPALPRGGRTARASMLTSALAKLATRHPPAGEELLHRLQTLRQRLLAGDDQDDAVSQFASFARAANQPDALLSLYDQLPADSDIRRSVGIYAFRHFVEKQRYGDAARSQSHAVMASALERLADNRFASARDFTLQTVATNIEVLAGAGDLARARAMAERLFKYEPSPEARALVQQHLARAGHPALLEKPVE